MTETTQTNTTQTNTEQAVRDTYAAYLAAFQQPDAAQAVQPYFQFPCLALTAQGDIVVNSAEVVGQIFGAMKARLATQDYASSEIQDMSVKLLSDTLAAISLVALRYNSQGTEIERLGCFYLLRQSAGQWRFVQLAMYDAERVLRLA